MTKPTITPCVVTGQQIGVGWTPALSVVKALAALVVAKKLGGRAHYWMADEDHDRLEVSTCVSLHGLRISRHRFSFDAPQGTACGFLPWGAMQQSMAQSLWGDLPEALTPTLKGHVQSLAKPLEKMGLGLYSPLSARQAPQTFQEQELQVCLEKWRSLNLEQDLLDRALELRSLGDKLPLNPENQHAWFAIHPKTGLRTPLKLHEKCPTGHWLSPGAALRPLMQSYLLSPTHVVLGPSESQYWRLTEPLWEKVGLLKPQILARPSVFILPSQAQLRLDQLEALRLGQWDAFSAQSPVRPSLSVMAKTQSEWGKDLTDRFQKELFRFEKRLEKLDRRLLRDQAIAALGMDPEKLRQILFPLGKPQERVLPGVHWLRPRILNLLMDGLESKWNPLDEREDQPLTLLLNSEEQHA